MPSLLIHHCTTFSTTPSSNSIVIKKQYRESNRLLPILKIYSDLLEYIFLLGVSSEDTIQQRQHAIFSYSQTCHDWRVVAMSLKSLWATLVDFEVNSEAWNRELLRRSYPSPIVVGSTAYMHRYSRVISAELMHLERMRIYRVGFDTSAWDILVERLQQPAPHIEYLNLNHVYIHSVDSFILPSTLFAGHAPHLKRLEMTQCLVDFEAPVLRSLTTLSVEYLSVSVAPTPLEWLEHLNHLPSLTSLRLTNSMRSQGHYTLRTDQVQLSLLSGLNLDARLHDMHIFIDGLNFPVSCALTVSCSKCYPGPELDIVLLAYLRRLNYAHDLRPESCPFLIHARSSELIISNNSPGDSHSNTAEHEPPTLFLNLCLDINFGFELWESFLTPILSILGEAFSSFTSLNIHLPAAHPGLLPYLIRATRLTQLTNVSATTTKNLLSKIKIIQSSQFVPLPALRTIVFVDDESMWGAPYQAFVSFLTWRRNIGYPITRVLFRRCMVLYDTAQDLGLLGVQVDCDLEGLRWQQL